MVLNWHMISSYIDRRLLYQIKLKRHRGTLCDLLTICTPNWNQAEHCKH